MIKDIEIKIFDELQNAVINYDEKKVRKLSKEVLRMSIDPKKAIIDGLAKGMKEVGNLYSKEIYSIPEVLVCSEAMKVGMNILKPYLKVEHGKKNYKIVIGTVEGDIHSIGKNIVKMMLEVNGFELIDLGENVNSNQFVNELNKNDVNIVALSTMMSTTLSSMKKIIDEIKNNHNKVSIMIGGASVTKEIADKFKADGYGKDSKEAVGEATRIIKFGRS